MNTEIFEQDECDRCHGPIINPVISGSQTFCSEQCKDNWEPADGPGWEGGFAPNH